MRNLHTTQDQNFYRELILKEAYTRLAWKIKYSQEYPTSSTARRFKSISNSPSVSKLTLPPVVQTQKQKTPVVTPVVTQRALSETPLMRPVSPHTKASLYNGVSHEGKGRHLYLKKRSKQGPEEKFEYPLLSSWDYGWRLGDYEINCKTSANGRSEIVRNTFYAKNGIFNIPSATDRLG